MIYVEVMPFFLLAYKSSEFYLYNKKYNVSKEYMLSPYTFHNQLAITKDLEEMEKHIDVWLQDISINNDDILVTGYTATIIDTDKLNQLERFNGETEDDYFGWRYTYYFKTNMIIVDSIYDNPFDSSGSHHIPSLAYRSGNFIPGTVFSIKNYYMGHVTKLIATEIFKDPTGKNEVTIAAMNYDKAKFSNEELSINDINSYDASLVISRDGYDKDTLDKINEFIKNEGF